MTLAAEGRSLLTVEVRYYERDNCRVPERVNTTSPDGKVDELIEIQWRPLVQALDWCNDGTITDAKTLIGLYRAGALIKNAVAMLPEDPGC